MSFTVRSLSRRLFKPARPARRARPGLERLEDRSLLSGTITGLVFEDYNANGAFNPNPTLPNAGTGSVGLPADRGLAGVTVTAFDGTNTARGTTVTGADGTYTLTATGTGPYRVEFTTLPAGFFPGPHGPDSGGTVQFAPDGTSAAKLGLTRPADYSPDNPPLVMNSYAFGDPINGAGANDPVIVRLPYAAGTQDSDAVLQDYNLPAGQPLATASQVGATWGLGYDNVNQNVYAAAYFKRHAGFGPAGTGAVYQMSATGSTPTVFADLNALFGSGTAGDNVHNVSDYAGDNYDVAWNAVGKDSLGGLAVSADGSRVYVMNLADRQLYALPTTVTPLTASVVYRASVPVTPGATGVTPSNPLGDLRPFAVAVYNGKVYVGLVNSAESTQNVADLKAYVYQVTDTGSSLVFGSSPVFQMSLNYPRGLADVGSNSSAAWHPWVSAFANIDTDGAGLVYAQPMLAGLAFDAAGNMVLGFRDRLGDQADAATPISPANQTMLAAHPAGDTLRAFGNPTAGWVLESNARGPGGQGTGPQGTGQGPGGGEFYFQDNLPAGRDEVTAGGVLQLANYPDVVVTAYDPVRIGGVFNGGGARWFNDTTGANDKGYQLFDAASGTGQAFGEANGVGDVTALLDRQPIEIGHRVWQDLNRNGIQDANEPGIAGVTVQLYDSSGALIAQTLTDANGNYYFGGNAQPNLLLPNTAYQVRIPIVAPLDRLEPTVKNAGTNRAIDSDATQVGANAVIALTTGGPGANDPTLDAGFQALRGSLSGFVYVDANDNGVRNTGETGIAGVTLALTGTDSLGNAVNLTTVTAADGSYSFTGLRASDSAGYTITETQPNGLLDGKNAVGTINGTPVGSLAGPTVDAITGIVLPADQSGVEYDFGELQPASLSGTVYIDANDNGVLNTGEAPIAGVTVTLTGTDDLGNAVSLTTQTAADGTFSFTGLRPSNSAGYTLTETQPANFLPGKNAVGKVNGVTDGSLAGPTVDTITGIRLNSGDAAAGYTFGELEPASLSGTVYVDTNNNGVLDAGEQGIPGVTLRLTGTDDLGNAVSLTTTTVTDGFFAFTNLRPSGPAGYTLTETQPAGLLPGKNAVGTNNGVTDGSLAGPTVDTITGVRLNSGDAAVGYTFGELQSASVSGTVYIDANDNGVLDAGEAPIAGVTLKLTGTDDLGNAVSLTTQTAADGTFSFTGLRPSGTAGYTLTETQPAGLLPGRNAVGTNNATIDGSLAGPVVDTITGIRLSFGDAATGYTFGELQPARLGGVVFVDLNNDGVQQSNEPPLPNVTVTLFGRDDLGNTVNQPTTTAADGSYSFANLRPGAYAIIERPPSYFALGKVTVGSLGGTAGSPFITAIQLNSGDAGTGYNFAALPPASLSGQVFADFNNDGVRDGPDFPVAGAIITLSGTDANGNSVNLTALTAADGSYRFDGLAPGTYVVADFISSGFFVGKSVIGSAGGTAVPQQVQGIGLPLAFNATGYNFGAVPVVDPAGTVYLDLNRNGVLDPGEPGLPNVQVAITGTDVFGTNVFNVQNTDANGHYQFGGLAPGVYTITENPPVGYFLGALQNGTPPAASVSVANRQFVGIDLTTAVFGGGYNFAHILAGVPTAINPIGALFPQVDPTFSGKIELLGNGPIDNVVFVNALYQQILGRAPDVDGVNFWVYRLDVGISSRQQVAAAFWQSPEHRGEQVDLFYATLLHRASDPFGRAFWVNAFLQGAGEDDVAAQLIASPEYQALHPDNASFVTGLYQDVLLRNPDAGGLAYWQSVLQGGASRAAVARLFLTSQEGAQQLLNRYYLQYLGRNPDPVAEAVWLTPLESGGLATSIVAEALIASDEFLARAKTLVI